MKGEQGVTEIMVMTNEEWAHVGPFLVRAARAGAAVVVPPLNAAKLLAEGGRQPLRGAGAALYGEEPVTDADIVVAWGQHPPCGVAVDAGSAEETAAVVRAAFGLPPREDGLLTDPCLELEPA